MRLRIRRLDEHNWVLEREVPGGKPFKAGGKEGVSRGRWDITGYHPSLERACRSCLTETVEPGMSGMEILNRLVAAEAAILRALQVSPREDRSKIVVEVDSSSDGQ